MGRGLLFVILLFSYSVTPSVANAQDQIWNKIKMGASQQEVQNSLLEYDLSSNPRASEEKIISGATCDLKINQARIFDQNISACFFFKNNKLEAIHFDFYEKSRALFLSIRDNIAKNYRLTKDDCRPSAIMCGSDFFLREGETFSLSHFQVGQNAAGAFLKLSWVSQGLTKDKKMEKEADQIMQETKQSAANSLCPTMAKLAETIMRKRQNGVPVYKVIEAADSQKGALNSVVRLMIDAAYATPGYLSESSKEKAVSDFSAEQYTTCMRTMR